MTTREPIKIGKLVFVRVWPNKFLWATNGRPLAAGVPSFCAYGYQHLLEYWTQPDKASTVIRSTKTSSFPLVGIVVERDLKVRKEDRSPPNYRFYKVYVSEANRALWFPESDISLMTKRSYKETSEYYEAR